MLPTLTPEGDDTVHGGDPFSSSSSSAAVPPTSCPRCGTPRHAGRHGLTCVRCLLTTGLELDPEPGEGAEAGPSVAGGRGGSKDAARFFDHYELAQRADGTPWELGRGAMGVTYKALDVNLRVPVALKVIHPHLLHEPAVRERFVREARAAAGLRHPNVAAVHHLGTRGEEWFFAMEFIAGETLDALVRRRGPLDAALALEIGAQVARALGAAHREGLVHRDVKPANLMLVNDPGTGIGEGPWLVKVIDFGVAKSAAVAAAGGADLTGGLLVGTPSFASPEQLRGEAADFRSDLYSLGVTLWWALLGRAPFTGDSFQVVGQHLSKPPPFGDLKEAKVPAPVVALLRTMLEKDPRDRPQTPAELLDNIAGAAAALPTSSLSPAEAAPRRTPPRSGQHRSPSVPVMAAATRWRTRARRRVRRWAPVAGGFALAAVGVWLAAIRREPSPPPSPAKSSDQTATTPTATTLAATSKPAAGEGTVAAATVRSLAVLPFRRSGGGEAEALLADGLAEDVTARLSKLESLRVVSQTSSSLFRDSPLPPAEIATRLGVRGLLSGRLRQARDGQFTVWAELLDAPDGGRVLWSQTYDHLRPDDLTLVQGRLVEDIAAGLQLVLSPAKKAVLARPTTSNTLAYDRYLRGRAFYNRFTPVDLERAAGFFQQALELDPDFATARAALAETFGQQFLRDGDRAKLEKALAAARESVRLDPNVPETHRAMALLHYYEGRYHEAIRECQRALEVDPNYVPAMTLAGGAWRNLGRLDQALSYLRRAETRNPLDALGQNILGETLILLDDDAGARMALQQALTLQPDRFQARLALAYLHLLRGEMPQARAELEAARSLSSEDLYGRHLATLFDLIEGQNVRAEQQYRALLSSGQQLTDLRFYDGVSNRSALGLLRQRAGDAPEAARWLEEAARTAQAAIQRSPDESQVIYDLAAVRALQGRPEEALVCLQQASAAGWCHHRITRLDPRFASLANDERFRRLLREWEDQVAQMRRAATENQP